LDGGARGADSTGGGGLMPGACARLATGASIIETIRTVDVSRMDNLGARITGALTGTIGVFVTTREAVWHRGAAGGSTSCGIGATRDASRFGS
jgi:hypothetical protein